MFGLNWNLLALELFSDDTLRFRLGLGFNEEMGDESFPPNVDDAAPVQGLGLDINKLDDVGVVIHLILSFNSPCFSASMHTLDDGLSSDRCFNLL